MNHLPHERRNAIIQASEMQPEKATEDPGLWRRFINTLRQTVGLKSLELAEEFARAKILQEQTAAFDQRADAEARLLEAKNAFEVGKAKAAEKRAAARKTNAEAKRIESQTKINEELVQRLLHEPSTEEAVEDLRSIIQQIEKLGGSVEFDLPSEDLLEFHDGQEANEGGS